MTTHWRRVARVHQGHYLILWECWASSTRKPGKIPRSQISRQVKFHRAEVQASSFLKKLLEKWEGKPVSHRCWINTTHPAGSQLPGRPTHGATLVSPQRWAPIAASAPLLGSRLRPWEHYCSYEEDASSMPQGFLFHSADYLFFLTCYHSFWLFPWHENAFLLLLPLELIPCSSERQLTKPGMLASVQAVATTQWFIASPPADPLLPSLHPFPRVWRLASEAAHSSSSF